MKKVIDRLAYENIIRFEADVNYTKVFYIDGGMDTVCHTLKVFELNLKNEGFIRVHKSCIVNVKHVLKVCKKRNVVIVKGASQIKIARRRIKETILVLTQVQAA
ncbi:MAG: LytR/AlgR family response regulator transcription factor [Spirosomataceae bacterium]